MKKLRHRLSLGMLWLGVSVLAAHVPSANSDQEYQKAALAITTMGCKPPHSYF